MKIGVLTSSRADYGVYLPLLKRLKSDKFFSLEIIAFGTHLSNSHGFTVTDIEKDEYSVIHKIATLISNDDEQAIATSYGLTVIKFADFWKINKFNLVFCLGDRFEMSAAVQAGIPFGIKFAHIHGGETTLGAIDNIYRHQISLASILHFTANDFFSEKIYQLSGFMNNIYSIGSLSLDGIELYKPISKLKFYKKFNIPHEDFALITFHPETINSEMNIKFAYEVRKALSIISSKLYLVITMPNADTLGSVFRREIECLKNEYPERVICVENFGKENYFSAMYYSRILIGNTSSGIIEAASFGKYVINVGDRQKGRLQSDNIINAKFGSQEIVDAVNKALVKGDYFGGNIYYKANSSNLVINYIKDINEFV